MEPGAGVSEDLCSAETVQGFAGTLVPLLLEVWVEAVGGGRVQTDSGHLLSEEAMALMFQILTILQLLRRLAPQKDQQDMLVCTHTHPTTTVVQPYIIVLPCINRSTTRLD